MQCISDWELGESLRRGPQENVRTTSFRYLGNVFCKRKDVLPLPLEVADEINDMCENRH